MTHSNYQDLLISQNPHLSNGDRVWTGDKQIYYTLAYALLVRSYIISMTLQQIG